MNRESRKVSAKVPEPREENTESCLSAEQRINFLLGLLGQMQENRKVNEDLEHKVAFAVTALLLGLSAYAVKGEYSLNDLSRLCFAGFSACMATFAVLFLLRNGTRIRFQCKVIVRIEQALGLYEENLYMSPVRAQKCAGRPFKEATIFPLEAQRYGESDWALVLTPHIIVVVFAGIVACVVVLLDGII